MDFDLSKENIQPLRGGRNVTQLGMALQAQTNREYQNELLQQKEMFEKTITNYVGDDPLDNYYQYISWVEQSYPKHGHEGDLVPLLEQCLNKFENDKRYTNDRRFCKLWIKYIDLQQNPLELYNMLHARGLCRGCADLYRAWAYYHEAAGDFQNAKNVFELGKRDLAQPYDELENAHKNLIMAAGQHLLYGPDERGLVEKRQALTSLLTYKPGRVGSVRVGNSSGAGIVPSSVAASRANSVVPVYEDHGEEFRGAEAAPLSIIAAARRQEVHKENTLKPGPWTTVPVKVKGFSHKTPGFTVHEDGNDSFGSRSFHQHNFPPESLEDYSGWRVSMTVAEPDNPKMIPMYPKSRVYIDPHTEYSIEELRGRRYNARKNTSMHMNSSETHQAVQSILDCGDPMQESIHEDKHEIEVVGHPSIYNQSVTPHQQSQLGNSSPFLYNHSHQEVPNYPTSVSHVEHSFPTLQHPINPHQQTLVNESLRTSHVNFAEPVLNHPSPLPLIGSQSPIENVWGGQDDFVHSVNQAWTSNLNNSEVSMAELPKPVVKKFSVYEQSMQQECSRQIHSKGSAMKTPFKCLNADELAETGSRGGMDIAATAQPNDSAKPMPVFSDDSSSSFEEAIIKNPVFHTELNATCNTQMFNFNLDEMKVSTPQGKQQTANHHVMVCEDDVKDARKQLFSEPQKEEVKGLSTILEETKSYGSSSSSSGATTKSSIFGNHTTKHNNMATISEEHNSYLAENMMANAALRSSLLGDLMDFDTHPQQPYVATPAPMQSSPMESPVRKIPAPAVVTPLTEVPSDPFKSSLINKLLERVRFPGPHSQGYHRILNNPRIVVKKEPVFIGNERYIVEKQLGKGTFGTVFKALDLSTNRYVALKYQKPPNKWEFYICRELQARLAEHPLRDRFMDVTLGYFSDQGSILVSDFMSCGSLLDLANTVKQKTSKSMKHSLCIYFGIEILRLVKAMHQVKIIHADIKPDNFLVQLSPEGVVELQLIDFGCSIDMSLFPPNAAFTRKVTTEDFVCCEMRDGRPWNYHTDLFCVAATVHVLLFDKYIPLQEKDGIWSITSRFARYARMDLWNTFFYSLLNQHAGPADVDSLLIMLEEGLECLKDDLSHQMRMLVNILRNR